jgi:hypothetical protein
MKTKLTLLVMLVASLAIPGGAAAAPILFDFNSISDNTNSSSGEDAIENYMEGIYGSEITLALGARAENDKIEGRPTGAYLGPDIFLINRWNTTSISSTLRDRISITFEDVPITGLEFDWEIFPVTESGQNADLTVKVWTEQQLVLEQPGTTIFFSQLLGPAKEAGALGHESFAFSAPVTMVQFIDWNDAPIGIDNLSLPTQVPLPGTLALLGAGLVGFGINRARRRARKPEDTSPASN